jgi:tetratricopeptide (TPR) repeat protein
VNIKNTNPKHGLTTEEMRPYITKAGEKSNNWMVHSTHLLYKSRIESESNKTMDRAALQLEVLVNQFSEKEPSVKDRINYIYNLEYPIYFKIYKELGDLMFNYGAIKSALDIFERLNMKEEIINCYVLIDSKNKALEIINDEINNENSVLLPEMYWWLGFIHNEPSYWEKSWEISKQRFSKSKRSLGRYYVNNQNYELAIKNFEEALLLNSCYPMCFFSLGCCYMFIENYESALKAFSRVIQQNPEDSDSWANMGSIYLKIGDKERAYKCVQEAIKVSQESWKLWENFMFISYDVKHYFDTIRSISKLVKLNKSRIDFDLLINLIMIMKEKLDENIEIKQYAEFLRSKIQLFFQDHINQFSDNPRFYDCYCIFLENSKFLKQETKIYEMRSIIVR